MSRPAEVHNDRPRICPECREGFPGFEAYWDHAEATHGFVWRNGKLCPSVDQEIGIGRSALYVLGIWPTARIHRDTVRALAKVNMGAGKNSRQQFGKSLVKAERDGLIAREGGWIHILDRPGVYARAVDSIDSPSHEKFLAVREAIPSVVAQIAAERDAQRRAARERELSFIRSLMRPYEGPMTGSRRPVRVVGAGRVD